jgi:hypothetical protein
MLRQFIPMSCHFLSPDARVGGWTQTLNLELKKLVFYHAAGQSATTNCQQLDLNPRLTVDEAQNFTKLF